MKSVCVRVCDWVGYVNDFSLFPKYIFINSDRAFVELSLVSMPLAKLIKMFYSFLAKVFPERNTRAYGGMCPLSWAMTYRCSSNIDVGIIKIRSFVFAHFI